MLVAGPPRRNGNIFFLILYDIGILLHLYNFLCFAVIVDICKKRVIMAVNPIYNLEWIFKHIVSDLDAVEFFQTFNIIPKVKTCDKKHEMQLKIVNNCTKWVCFKKACNKSSSVRTNTWLEGSTLSLKSIILFIYSWAKEYTNIKFCEWEIKINHSTAVDFNNYLREVINNIFCLYRLKYSL